MTHSRSGAHRLIRPLVFVTEDITTAYAASCGVPLVPCGCGQRAGTVRGALRDLFGELEREHPHLKETMLSAMGNVDTSRLLDTRFLNLDGGSTESAAQTQELFPIITEVQSPVD